MTGRAIDVRERVQMSGRKRIFIIKMRRVCSVPGFLFVGKVVSVAYCRRS